MVNKKAVAMVVAEFLGTALLTLVVLSVKNSAIGIPYFVAIGAGLAVGVAIVGVGTIYGAQLNPAVTVGLWTLRKMKSVEALAAIAFQLLGAWAAYWLFTYFVNNRLTNIAGHYEARIMIAEAVGAFVFTFALAAAIYRGYTGARLAASAAVAFTLGIIVASAASNGIINPALALGLRSWNWLDYIVGPLVGSIIGMNLYSLLFVESPGVVRPNRVSSRPATATAAAKSSSASSRTKKKK